MEKQSTEFKSPEFKSPLTPLFQRGEYMVPFSRGFNVFPRTHGYTLIELLLVIAIVGILLAVGTLTYRTLHTHARLDRTALEMQNFLEGAMAYKVDKGSWPAQNSDLGACSTDSSVITNDNFVPNYVPNQTTLSQLGYYYCWSQGPVSTGSVSALFWTAVKIPQGDSQMAAQLAAKLPNGVVTRDPTDNSNPTCTSSQDCYVRTTVATPNNNGSTTSTTSIAAFGTCSDSNKSGSQSVTDTPTTVSCVHITAAGSEQADKYRVSFTCSANTTANLVVTPNEFYQINPGHGTEQNYPLVELRSNNIQCTSSTTPTCTFEVIAKILRNGSTHFVSHVHGSVGASYVAMCVPNT